MTTLSQLQYMIEANTDGLNKAVPALEKLVTQLERLEKGVQSLNSSFTSGMKSMGAAAQGQAAGVASGTAKVVKALKTQEVALISAASRVKDLNNSIQASGAPSRLLANTARAYQVLDKQLNNTKLTAEAAAKAKAKFNASMATVRRELKNFNAAQAASNLAQRQSDAAILRQTNSLERMRIKYLDLVSALEGRGASSQMLDNLSTQFQKFEADMTGGVLNVRQFSESVNGMNATMAGVRRQSGFAAGIAAGMSELATSAQVALGPLSGIAARITALNTLAGATTFGVAALVGGIIALGTALAKSIMDGARFEQQMKRIGGVLEATGNAAIISASRVEMTVRKVAQATNTAQGEIREAASGLLTITGMNEELLESSLEAAKGLAILGGGDIMSSYRNLAQVLQEPAQGLQTLTQYSIKFTAAERERIIALEQAGRKQEAIAAIMEKLGPAIALATSEQESLTGAYANFLDKVTSVSQDFAVQTGLLKALANGLNGLANTIATTGHSAVIAWQAIKNLLELMGPLGDAVRFVNSEFNLLKKGLGLLSDGVGWLARDVIGFSNMVDMTETSVTSLMAGVIDLHDAMQNANLGENNELNEGLKEIIRRMEEVKGTNLTPNVDVRDLVAAAEAIKAGDVGAATAALEKYTKVQEDAAKSAQLHANAVNEAYSYFVTLKEEYGGITVAQEKQANQLAGLTEKWHLIREAMMNAGKTQEQAEATLRRMRTEIENQSGTVSGYVDQVRRSIVTLEMDAKITAAVGAEKRRLQVEQQVLNELWASGVINSANYTQALVDLREQGLGALADEIERVSREAAAADFAVAIAELNKEMDDTLAKSRLAARTARESSFAQAEAMKVLEKQQELLNMGIEEGSEAWRKQIAAVKELNALEFEAKWSAETKGMEDELRAAQVAAEAVNGSLVDGALAVALVNEQIRMMNEGIAEGSALWNQRLGLVRQMVDMDFARQHNEEIKSMQMQMATQDAVMRTMFMTEDARTRAVALAQKEIELANKYGSILDARAQKELQVFQQLQARDQIINDWQEVAGAIEDMFKGLEDELVNFAKTGEFNWRKLASSILEDIFRITYRATIAKPLQNWLGGLMGNALGDDAASGGAKGIANFWTQPGATPANPSYVMVMNAMPGMPGSGNPLSTITDALTGGSPYSAPGPWGAGMSPLATGLGGGNGGFSGAGPVGEVIRQALPPIQDLGNVSQAASTGIDQAVQGFDYATQRVIDAHTSVVDGIDFASQRVAQAHDMVGDSVNQFGTKIWGAAQDAQSALGDMASAGDQAAKALSNGINPQAMTDMLQLSSKDIQDIMKVTQTEVVQSLSGPNFQKQVGGVVDTVLNRRMSDAFPDSIQDVINQPRQFSKITGPANLNPYGNIDNMPFSQVNQRTQDAVMQHLQGRAGGMPSSVGGHLNYLNPDHSTWNNIKPGSWGESVVNQAKASGQIFGGPGSSHFHGTAPGHTPVGPYGVGMPGQQGGWGAPSAFNGGGLPGTAPLPTASPLSTFGGASGMPNMGGMGADGGLGQLSSSVQQVNSSFTKMAEQLPEVTTNLTSGLDKAATSASDLANDGLNRAASGMQNLSENAIQQTIQSQIQSAATTQQMGTQSMVTSAQITQLGTAAMTASAQMSMGGMVGLFHTGGIVGSGAPAARMYSGSFAGAPRLHGGLAPNEFKAILKKGEGVFTEEQMEALGSAINYRGEAEANGGGRGRGGGGGIAIHLHGVKDYDSFKRSESQLKAAAASASQQAAWRNQ